MSEKPTKIDYKYNITVYYDIVKKYYWLFILVLIIVLIMEALYLADRFLFKIIVDEGTSYGAGTITKDALSSKMMMVGFAFALVILVKIFGKWFRIHYTNKLDGALIYDLKLKFFNHIIGLSHQFHTSNKTGSLISRLTRGGRSIEKMTDIIIFNFAPMVFQLLIVAGSLIYFDFMSGFIVFVVVTIFVVYSYFMQKRQEESNIKANDAEDFEKGNIADIFTNIDSIKYFGKEKHIKDKFRDIAFNTKNLMIHNWNFFRWLDSGQSLILNIGTFLLVYFPLVKFLNNQISLGTIVFIYTAYGTLTGYLFGFVQGLREYFRVMADFESLFEYNKIENEIKDPIGADDITISTGEIEFKNVSFNYGKRKIMEDFSLKVKKNQKIAFVGHSGSGKSTLIKLLYRLYDIDKGEILIDKHNIKYFKQEILRSEMSIVPQECVLFDDTIYNNVAFSRPESTREEIMNAIKSAQLDRIINEFPNKENTIVGERGVKLSGGEKQRVSIARAILANKKILVLDEATSSLDSQTEHEIQKALEMLMKGRTSIIIAHRLSTIMKADVIIVLKKGKIVQQGTHKGLIRKKGEYQNLWNLQKGGYIQ